MNTTLDQIVVHDLRELVAALDRRVPRIGPEGERDIARDAQGLRRAALNRIAELERLPSFYATGTVAQEAVVDVPAEEIERDVFRKGRNV